MRVLIAGVGNELRGDDGFGIEALRLLKKERIEGIDPEYLESGIAGIGLVQRLFDRFDALIILDALDRGAPPGTVFVLEPDLGDLQNGNRSAGAIDLHQADPEGVLRMAAALGILPPRVWIVGCQAADCDELGARLSESVRRALPEVVRRVYDILTNPSSARSEIHGSV